MFIFQSSGVLELRQPEAHSLGSGDIAQHFYQQVLDKLEAGDRFAELFSLLCIEEGILIGAHHTANRLPGDEGAGHPQDTCRIPKALIHLKPVALGDYTIPESDMSVL